MSHSIVVLAEALNEAAEAVNFLEQARPGLGEAFTSALADAFKKLEAHPALGALAEFGQNTRRWKLARFPCSILYLVESERLLIVAIAHERRSPQYWRLRAK